MYNTMKTFVYNNICEFIFHSLTHALTENQRE